MVASGGTCMKPVRLFLLCLFLIAVAVLSPRACWADGAGPIDPQPKTQGCNGKGQPPCDLSPVGESISLTFENVTVEGVTVVEAMASVDNSGPTALGQFVVNFPTSVTIDGVLDSLTYTCGSPGVAGYSCTPEGGGTFLFTAPSISDDLCYSDQETACQPGETVILEEVEGDPNLLGVTLTAATSTTLPEPASGLLLLFGLAAGGLTGLRKRLHL